MPLKLYPPKPGRSPYFTIRGTLHGQSVYRSTGTANREEARKVIRKVTEEIKDGTFALRGDLLFEEAALSYLDAGGSDEFLRRLSVHFKGVPVKTIRQEEIDAAARKLYPNAAPATRNRQVYTPISAILKHAGFSFPIKRPKGSAGTKRTEWMTKAQAQRILKAGYAEDFEFGLFLEFLLYTGLRLSEALWLECRHVSLEDRFAYVPQTKNEEPRAVHLPQSLVEALEAHPRGVDRGTNTLFRFRKNGHLYGYMRDARKKAGLPLVSFHTFRHTWASWMRRYGGLDTRGLVGTGAWRDEKSAARYAHVVVTEEAQRADLLPRVADRKARTK